MKNRRNCNRRFEPVKNAKKKISSLIIQDVRTREDGQTLSTNIPTEYKCPICLDSSGWKKMKNLPCSHAFHQSCVNTWLKKSKRCPLCRKVNTYPKTVQVPANNIQESNDQSLNIKEDSILTAAAPLFQWLLSWMPL
ncbi:E3 ubiquitin-protein ligase RNF126 like protein [Argiope bruennichi]|uniref:E3 ubiquitin-protein ligase RNF126 like protein n=1 Tax=Argiope bruennichi TaxID=94029 RepID=A0A8T0F121_ARGBR|nr:E3 ubiquitin-protein ligase RNF126 like protein [Argiope bruennichi]